MENNFIKNIKIENAQIICKNFAGRATEFNEAGKRNFGLIIPFEMVDDLIADGWNIKYLRPREDDPEQIAQPWLPVKVKFGNIPPICQLVTPRGRIKLDEDNIDQLDWTRIATCDVVVRPYSYPAMRGREAGVSAYLKALYVVPVEEDFESKYADIPEL